MISVVASWIIIFCISLIFGYGVINFVYKDSKEFVGTLDMYLVTGLMLVNVYAEVFSLVYKVSGVACLALFLIGIILLVTYHISGKGQCWKEIKAVRKVSGYQWVVVGIAVLATLAWTIGSPAHYDTDLYHFQAIKWIEEYGVVPGLGNLHNRFAYNSAFMPLQALFGFEWLIGQALHTVNGYVCCIFLIYAIASNSVLRKEKMHLSDLFKVATVIYIYYTRGTISSPSSDILTMLLILYVCTKWSEFIEKGIKDAIPYTVVCVICVWAVSVKLSAAVCVILAIYPAVLLIKRKQWKDIIINIVFGLLVVVPWLARNVIISGYLLYPYPQIDLFNVDWKMPASVLTYDSREIMVWGRGVKDVLRYEETIFEWFPVWIETVPKSMVFIGITASVGLLIYRIIKLIKEKKINPGMDLLICYSIFALVTWLFSAPLMRYGMVYLLVPVCLLCAILFEKIQRSKGINVARTIILLLIIPIMCIYVVKVKDINYFVLQGNYSWRLTEENELVEGVKIWTPAEGDRGSYDVFPCVPYKEMLKKIELRGNGFEDGFRIKEEYRDKKLNAYGKEW